MPEYRVNVHSSNRVRNSLRTLAAAHKDILDPVVKEWAQDTRAFLKRPYPPKLANQKYVRTGRLGNSFRVERRGLANYQVVNTANAGYGPYASRVIGDDNGDFRQAQIHSGRWFQMGREIESKLPDLRARIEHEMSRIGA